MAECVADVAVYMLDVGQGDCTFVLSGNPSDGAVLFDCKDPYVAERFVVDHGIQTLHAVVVSHLDADHIAGMLPFLRWYLSTGRTLGRVYAGIDRDRTSIGDTAARLLDALLRWNTEKKISLEAPQRGGQPTEVMAVAKAWSASIIIPTYADIVGMRLDAGEEPNRCSVALRVVCGDTAVLVGGDAPLVSWERVAPELLSAFALRGPHHGGGIRDGSPSWSEKDLYDRVAPQVVALSVGTCNPYGHPVEEHLRGIDPARRRLICTQITPRCHDDVPGIRAELLRSASSVTYASYRHRAAPGDARRRPRSEAPCAGSILVELFANGDTPRVEPARPGWHDRQILDLRLTSPCCMRSKGPQGAS